MNNRIVKFSLLLIMIFTLGYSVSANAQKIIVPPEFANMADFGGPNGFDCTNNGPNGVRAQTLFPAEDLIRGDIVGIANRLFPDSPGFPAVTIPNVTIKFSTTQVAEGNLSPIFANNVGPDETIVFQGNLPLGPVPNCGTDPCPFPDGEGLLIPFPYNPANGNLLLEVIVPSCVGGVPNNVVTDLTGLLQTALAMDSDANTADIVGDAGFITEFTFVVSRDVPTLSEWGLIVMAIILGGVSFIVLRKRKAVA